LIKNLKLKIKNCYHNKNRDRKIVGVVQTDEVRSEKKPRPLGRGFLHLGQSLFEVVLALAVVTMITVGIVILTTDSLKNSTFSKSKNLSTKYSQEVMEWLRTQRDEDYSLFLENSLTPVYCMNSLSLGNSGACSSGEVINGTNLTRELYFTRSLLNGKTLVEALVVVSWSDSQGYHEARSTANFTDIREK